jgi:hypothetical protein
MVRYKVKEATEAIDEASAEPVVVTSAEAEQKASTKTCAHHWIIEPAMGATSMGVCKLCGAVKEFSNQFKRSSLISQDFVDASPSPAKDGEAAETPVESTPLG